jgi:hypothetical protein
MTTTPLCPNCCKAMQPTRTIPRLGGLPQLNVYSCKPCGVAYAESESIPPAPERAAVLQPEWCTGIQ